MEYCRKTSFLNEEQALLYIRKLDATSTREKKPVRAYLCERCLTWHLTSAPDQKDQKITEQACTINELEKKVAELENTINQKQVLLQEQFRPITQLKQRVRNIRF